MFKVLLVSLTVSTLACASDDFVNKVPIPKVFKLPKLHIMPPTAAVLLNSVCAIRLKEIRVPAAKHMDPIGAPAGSPRIDPIGHPAPVQACSRQ